MLTPWFAVSVGIVVATSMTLAAPHPALTFPPSRSGHCVHLSCTSPAPLAKGHAPAITQETPLPVPPAGQLPPQRRSASAHPAVKVGYQLLPRRGNHFMAVVVIVGHRSLGKWNLRFRLPGAQIKRIIWAARWVRDGSDGVLVFGSPLPWPRSGANEARIVIFGSGSPGWPTGCIFDGGGCTFRKITSQPVRHDGGSQGGSRSPRRAGTDRQQG